MIALLLAFVLDDSSPASDSDLPVPVPAEAPAPATPQLPVRVPIGEGALQLPKPAPEPAKEMRFVCAIIRRFAPAATPASALVAPAAAAAPSPVCGSISIATPPSRSSSA